MTEPSDAGYHPLDCALLVFVREDADERADRRVRDATQRGQDARRPHHPIAGRGRL